MIIRTGSLFRMCLNYQFFVISSVFVFYRMHHELLTYRLCTLSVFILRSSRTRTLAYKNNAHIELDSGHIDTILIAIHWLVLLSLSLSQLPFLTASFSYLSLFLSIRPSHYILHFKHNLFSEFFILSMDVYLTC